MGRRRAVIASGIVLVILTVVGLTAVAVLVNVRLALWGMVAFFAVLLATRLVVGDTGWLVARSRLFDALFLIVIIAGLALTISAATTPSPV
ncbi:MAG: DUF3017 domain-containing protein [Actinomycetaceae bacterium]|nr:DUF3017 domain-containing protein [Actinomycetaceae bacterium]